MSVCLNLERESRAAVNGGRAHILGGHAHAAAADCARAWGGGTSGRASSVRVAASAPVDGRLGARAAAAAAVLARTRRPAGRSQSSQIPNQN